MELTNIKEGTQPAALFTVPKGYQKMPGMDEYYRGMLQQNGEATASAPASARQKKIQALMRCRKHCARDCVACLARNESIPLLAG